MSMNCQALREWLSADLDGEASAAEQAAVREHLAACAGCRRARAGAEALREELLLAASEAETSESEEALLATLHAEGLCRTDIQPRRHKEHKEVRLRTGWLTAAALVSRPFLEFCRSVCSLCLRGFRPIQYRSLRLAAGMMAVSFLVTWGALRWAETGPRVAESALAARAAAAPRLPAGDEIMNEWMTGTPSLAALERLQRLPPVTPPAREPVQRGAAAADQHRRMG